MGFWNELWFCCGKEGVLGFGFWFGVWVWSLGMGLRLRLGFLWVAGGEERSYVYENVAEVVHRWKMIINKI